MGIDFKVNFSTKIKVNGKEYASIDDVPEQHRQTVKEAMGSADAPGGHSKITVNGVGYDNVEDMPAEVRATYEKALQQAQAVARRTGDSVPLPSQPGPGRGAPVAESGLSGRTLTIILILIAAAFLINHFAPK